MRFWHHWRLYQIFISSLCQNILLNSLRAALTLVSHHCVNSFLMPKDRRIPGNSEQLAKFLVSIVLSTINISKCNINLFFFQVVGSLDVLWLQLFAVSTPWSCGSEQNVLVSFDYFGVVGRVNSEHMVGLGVFGAVDRR